MTPIDLAMMAWRFAVSNSILELGMGTIFLLFGLRLIQRQRVPIPTYGRRLFLMYLTLAVASVGAVVAFTWIIWHDLASCGTACVYFFPPYSNYYFNETLVLWVSTVSFNAIVGLTGGILFSWFARRTHGRIIDQVDVDLLTVGGMVAGWPNILLFYGLVFALTVLLTVVRAVLSRNATVRTVITPALPLAAALIAIFGDQISRWLGLYDIGLTLF